MSRILNEKEIKRLIELGIIKEIGHNYKYKYDFSYINNCMLNQKVTKLLKNDWNIKPWMIKKNWKKTSIFKGLK